jgi:uncharacterized cupin superfamily protein
MYLSANKKIPALLQMSSLQTSGSECVGFPPPLKRTGTHSSATVAPGGRGSKQHGHSLPSPRLP